MRITFTSPNSAQRAQFQATFPKECARYLSVTASLAEAYNAAELDPPNLAIFSEDLIVAPEFELTLRLLSALKTRILAVRDATAAGPLPKSLNHHVTFISDNPNDPVFRRALGIENARRPGNTANRRDGPSNESSVILLGSSTGGVEALIKILSGFPQDCPPVMMVQHTGGGFTAGLARLLNSKTSVRVCQAEDGLIVSHGVAVLAPGDRYHLQMRMRGTEVQCRLLDAPAIGGHRPAIDALFHSAVSAAPNIVAAILTGMGRDGAAGLLALKRAGARTFGQDEETSLVYGMPKAAAEMGALERQLPLDRIGPALIAASSERKAA